MTSLLRIFCLELTALVRSWTAQMLLAASLAWLFVAERFLVTDSTAEGHRELYIRYGLGGVFALLVVSLLAAATGAIASEREAKRLQLTQVRPVAPFAIAWGKFLALSLVGSAILAVSCVVVALTSEFSDRHCSHVLHPSMMSAREEALKMYDAFMNDPTTPSEVKKSKKSVVLRLLEQRAKDNYMTIQTNETAVWKFASLAEEWLPSMQHDADSRLAIRFKFSNNFNMRDTVIGVVETSGFSGTVSNVTQMSAVIPLVPDSTVCEQGVVRFSNLGKSAVMLRPRQDVELLVLADAFGWNLLRAFIVMASVLSFVVSFGLFLGAGLSRPVALFTAIVLLAVSEMSPSVVDQYPDQLETNIIDRIGLAMTRVVERGTKSVSSLSPLSLVASDDRIEPGDVAGTFVFDFVLIPFALCALAGVLIRRKQEGQG